MEKIAHLIKNSTSTVIFTGAGMSTESGLPDFRSKNRGLWGKFNPDELANVDALENNQEEFVNFYQFRLNEIQAYHPHDGHYTLAKWEKNGIIDGIITQNVDGFHHDAGNNNVMELHGTFRKFFCHHCKKEVERERFLEGQTNCSRCNGPIRPGIVLFGEMLPEDTFLKAEELTIHSEVFIVLGSSLTVTPANMFPILAKEHGATLIIVNREETPMDPYADYIINDQSVKEFLLKLDRYISA
ncbi:SIR2 family NAD-dependent protein deacylase [Ornithinibacillus halophilus]|uniref:protein acetyllysine N-acetyltransferase n=1 Tax=Ornithinibacillus halophilus TaxID=930117 RepID=A0A1M5G9I3_9BACI|nr:NAD-dependent deacylase [Ornithinibacillus halophilus]SHG00338.1 NAD-dependent deacetylase [Ornithinibacillus halophilus]